MIDGIVSGRLLLDPKPMRTRRGSPYLIAKMSAFGYATGAMKARDLNADLIVFDRRAMAELAEYRAGNFLTVCGIVCPVQEPYLGAMETVLKITVRFVLKDYLKNQRKNDGDLFRLIDRARNG